MINDFMTNFHESYVAKLGFKLAMYGSVVRSQGYKRFSCSTQLSMKFVLLINLKLLIIANSILLNIAEHENFSASKYENANY